MNITREDIEKARAAFPPVVHRTRLEHSTSLSGRSPAEVFLKYENEQKTGSFKIRGAVNKLSSLSEEERRRGVIACSAGNHAQGVALASRLLGVEARIVMPETAPIIKISATSDYGAQVILHGESFDQAYQHARQLEQEEGYTFVHPYEDPAIIAGQGTIGLEILEDLPEVDSIVVPIGGGGLISGIALAVKSRRPECRIYGVQSEAVSEVAGLFHGDGEPPRKKTAATIADGIAVKPASKVLFENFIRKYVDDVVTVSEDEIARAIVFLLERVKTVTEGSGAVGVAAAMSGKLPLSGNTCIILSGGNIDLNIISKVIERGLIAKGRLTELSVIVDDLPGNLSRVTEVIAGMKANILEVHHDRVTANLFLRETRIDFVLETSGEDHVAAIRNAVRATGARVLQES